MASSPPTNDDYDPATDPARKAKSKDPGPMAIGQIYRTEIMSHAFFVKQWCVEG
jgi:hypothetical protein